MAREPFSLWSWVLPPKGLWSLKVQDGSPIKNGISGRALVLRGNAGFSNLHNWTGISQLRVSAPGRDDFTVGHLSWIVRDKHPVRGFEMPVTLNRDDPSDLRIEWDSAPTMEERIAKRDPAIFDPEGTWRRVAPMLEMQEGSGREAIEAARDRAAQLLPASSVILEDLQDAATRGDPSHYAVTPFDQGKISDWPPAPDQVPKGRLAGTALVVSVSSDPFPFQDGDHFNPQGDHFTHFASRGGSISCSKYEYLGWLLLCVVPPSGARYGLYFRTHIHSRRIGAVLPVTIDAKNPSDIEIIWDALPSLGDLAVDKIEKASEKMSARVTEALALQQSSVAAAMADVQDPVMKAQVQKMWSQFGVQAPEGGQSATPPPAPTRDVASELARLQKLRDGGILNEDEYAEQRSKFLDSI
jgi:hypothetical protein